MYNFNIVNIAESVHKSHDRARVTTSFVDVYDIYGRDEEKSTLVSKLLSESNEDQNRLHIISIVGMGGMGKTTLAQFVYNDRTIIKKFENRIWVWVSDIFDEFRIAKAILQSLTGSASNLSELESLLKSIEKEIERKKFLLVLDDVWTEDCNVWNLLCSCLKKGNILDSKILVTTRKAAVARMIESTDIITIKQLSEDACWSLFKHLAFVDKSVGEREKLEEVGRKIVGKCKGLPLAIKTIGSLLHFERTHQEWERILKSEMWNLEEFKKVLFPTLLLSYNDLPYMIRSCFSYCAIFPKDYNMKKDQLIQLWMAQGYLEKKEMEVTGERYFNYLATRSFFQDFEKDEDGKIIGCKMHDMLHDFAQSLTQNECFALQVNDFEEPLGERNFLYAKPRHSMVTLSGRESSFPKSILNAEKLRSLLIYGDFFEHSISRKVGDKLCDELKCLRALGILRNIEASDYWNSSLKIEMILRKIGKMIHLRYLNLSNCRGLRELPETLCELCNLQTLDITDCQSLQILPQGIGKLINLRHLLNDRNYNLEYMPKGVERLACLRTVKEFVVSSGGGNRSTVGCLKNLNSLGGSLYIKYLGNERNVVEAEKAKLWEKQYLVGLTLNFEENNASGDDQRNIGRDEYWERRSCS